MRGLVKPTNLLIILSDQHSREVLAEFGYGAAEIDGFFADGVIEEPKIPVKA